MICFLTSLPVTEGTAGLNPANRFAGEMRRCVRPRCRGLFICSDPDYDNDTEAGYMKQDFEDSGLSFESFSVLDGRNAEDAAELVGNSDLIVLTGGHVPTQNRFFHRIGLRELLKGYGGVIMGISAGSMNSADVVYAQPELEGEAADPGYRRFLTGLGLTKTVLIPHYYGIKDNILDGMRVMEDITLPDSMGRTFYYIPDGSYLYSEPGREELRGEAYLVKDGSITRISGEGETVQL